MGRNKLSGISPMEIWKSMDLKLIAILRGILPHETRDIVQVLLRSGFRAIEIPLNTPDVYQSIKLAVETSYAFSERPCLIGAGTVLTEQEVSLVHEAGGNLIVSPNVNETVIRQTKKFGMLSAPGVYTASECLRAVNSGADMLKLFPASNLGPSGLKALRAVMPQSLELCAVGGVGDNDFKSYMEAGASSFGIGSSLYHPGMPANKVAEKATKTARAFQSSLA